MTKIEKCTSCDSLVGQHPNHFDLKNIKMFCVLCGVKMEKDNDEQKSIKRYIENGNFCSRCSGKCTINFLSKND